MTKAKMPVDTRMPGAAFAARRTGALTEMTTRAVGNIRPLFQGGHPE